MNTSREEFLVKEIARGIYVKWRVTKPSRVQKIMDAIDGRKTRNDNDMEMEVETKETRIDLSTFRDKVTIHSITVKETGRKVVVGESMDMSEMSRQKFCDTFYQKWLAAVEKDSSGSSE